MGGKTGAGDPLTPKTKATERIAVKKPHRERSNEVLQANTTPAWGGNEHWCGGKKAQKWGGPKNKKNGKNGVPGRKCWEVRLGKKGGDSTKGHRW